MEPSQQISPIIQERKIQTIIDEPSDEDLFSGNGHERTASSLASSIVEYSNTDAAIGLEGSWGSGKSTVLKLCEKKLCSSNNDDFNFLFFTIDLWTTHSDGFRRGFLETLIFWISNKSLLGTDLTKTYLDAVRGKHKKTIYRKNRQYNLLGVVFLALAPLLPIIYTWLSPFAFNKNIKDDWLINVPWAVLSILLLLYTAVIIKTIYLYTKKKNEKWSILQCLSSSLSIFTRDVEEETVSEDISEEDPSTVQFENTFRKIIHQIQSSSRNRIVIVLDNIDRLPQEDIPEVWSSIRSLLKKDDAIRDYSESSVTVVIPYDRKYLLKAFNSFDKEKKSSSFTSDDFIRKTFRRIFYVSPTVPTDWKFFFRNKLAIAIEQKFELETLYRLEKIIEYYFQDHLISPTPRQIINHINELAVLWQTWGDSISIESLSLFSWVRDQLDEDIELLKTEFISQRVQNLLGNIEWRRDIASLMYNVDTTHAYQALLSQDIIRLLPKDSESKLKELSKIKGFHSVLVDVIQTSTEEWAREDAILISNVIDNISLLDFGKHELNVIFSKISNTIPYLATRKKDQALDTFTGLIKLGNFSSNSDKAIATILDVMSWASINIKTINGDTNRAAKEWADFYLLMISDYDESLKSKISRTLILPSDPDFIVSLASSNPDLGTYNPSNLLIETEQIERAITKDYDKNATFTALKTLKNLFSSRFLTAIQRQCVDKLTRAESV